MAKVDIEKLDSIKREMTITVPPEKVEEELANQYKYLRKNVVIPGFRKGKAPLRILQKQFGQQVLGIVKEELVNNFSEEKLQEQEIDFLIPPTFIEGDFTEDGSFVFKLGYSEAPDFELESYENYTGSIKVQTKETLIENYKHMYQTMYAELEPKEDEPAEIEDELFVSYKITDSNTEEVLEDVDDFSFKLGDETIFPEFNESVEGAKPGETRSFPFTFPEDYPDGKFAGKDCMFEITVREVKTKSFPEIDEEFVTETLGFEDMEIFNEKVEEDSERVREDIIFRQKTDKLVNLIAEDYDFEIPQDFLEKYTNYRVELFQHDLSDSQLAEIKDIMEQRLRVLFVLKKIAEAEEIHLEDDELNFFATQIIREFRHDTEEFVEEFVQNTTNRTFLANDALYDKVLAFLLDKFEPEILDRDFVEDEEEVD